jgi:hypothetical protein
MLDPGCGQGPAGGGDFAKGVEEQIDHALGPSRGAFLEDIGQLAQVCTSPGDTAGRGKVARRRG